MLSEIDQTEKDKHHTISLIGAILKKKTEQTMNITKQKLTDTENKRLVIKGVRGGELGKTGEGN